MTTQPTFGPVDEQTGSLLDLLANTEAATLEPQRQWEHFLKVLAEVARPTGLIDQNAARPLLAGEVSPSRIGAFYRRAALEGRIRAEDWNESSHVEQRNAGKPQRVYRWLVA